jgi:hypothetical protein
MSPGLEWCLINLVGTSVAFAALGLASYIGNDFLGTIGVLAFWIGQGFVLTKSCGFAIRTFRGHPWTILFVALGSGVLQTAIIFSGCALLA